MAAMTSGKNTLYQESITTNKHVLKYNCTISKEQEWRE